MYVVAIPNRNSPPAILLRESFREGAKVKNRTLANLSHWAPERIEALRHVLKGKAPRAAPLEDSFEILRSRPHGPVAAALGMLRRLGLDALLASRSSRPRELCVAMIVERLLDPRSKLATARALDPETLHSTLGEVLRLGRADEDELYAAMDWLLLRQARIETALARRHLAEGSLVFYDVSSTWFEGRHCALARLGRPGDGKRGKLQIVFGLLVNAEGCPVAVEVFTGDTGDPKTLASQVRKLRDRFGLKRLVLVGDRGMITEARIREDLRGVEGLSWITALRAPAIQELVRQGSLQLSLFDEKDLAEISSPDYPGERLVVCKNPLLAEERARKREDLLRATAKELDAIVEATHREKRRLKDPKKIALRIGKVLGRFKVGKHFLLHITEEGFRYERDVESIEREAALDGFYVIRTSVPSQALSAQETVRAYKRLSGAERAFRSLKTVDLKVRPINHRLADRVRAHVFLCVLAYYVEWHMRRALAPLLFDDEHPQEGEARRASVVAPARRSSGALEKALTKRTEEGLAVHSFQSLLRNLATVTKNRVQPRGLAAAPFDLIATPTPLQRRAFELLEVDYRM